VDSLLKLGWHFWLLQSAQDRRRQTPHKGLCIGRPSQRTHAIVDQPLGGVPLTGLGALGGAATQVAGPGFSRLDFSLFKDLKLTERFRLQFRSEFFNILNHPNFNAPDPAIPGSLDFKSPTFGQIGSTRDAPNDPRQIQFALKLYY